MGVCVRVYVCMHACMRACTHCLQMQVSGQHVLAHGLLGQREPELAGLQRHVLVLVLRPLQHVLQEEGEGPENTWAAFK